MSQHGIRRSRAETFVRVGGLVGAIGVVCLIVASLVYLVNIASKIQQVQAETTKRGQEIQSCTTPGGACYERSQQQTGAAVGSINQVTILAVACARQPGNDTEAEVKACVEKGLQP